MAAEVHKLNLPSLDPHNEDAEVAILGAILQDNSVFDRLAGSLQGSDFFVGFHVDLYNAIAALIGDGRRADLVTLAPAIRGKTVHGLDAEDYVRKLPESAPDTPEKLNDYVREVLRFSAHRGVMEAARELGNAASQRDSKLIEAYDRATRAFDAALARSNAQRVTARPAGEWGEVALSEYGKGQKGLSTGLRDLDDVIGMLAPGELTILGGRPSMGKTTFASEIALNVALGSTPANPRHGVLIESMEMGGEPVAQRILSAMVYEHDSPIPYTKWRRQELTPIEVQRLREANERLKELPLIINTQAGMTLAQLIASARRAQAQLEAMGSRLSLIVIDYLGLAQLNPRWGDNRAYALGDLTAGLKEMAKSMWVHVLALHQLSRAVEQTPDKRPQMHHLRESGNLEQDADVVMFAFREEYYIEREGAQTDPIKEADRQARLAKVQGTAEIIIGKNRNGPIRDVRVGCSIANNKLWNLQPS